VRALPPCLSSCRVVPPCLPHTVSHWRAVRALTDGRVGLLLPPLFHSSLVSMTRFPELEKQPGTGSRKSRDLVIGKKQKILLILPQIKGGHLVPPEAAPIPNNGRGSGAAASSGQVVRAKSSGRDGPAGAVGSLYGGGYARASAGAKAAAAAAAAAVSSGAVGALSGGRGGGGGRSKRGRSGGGGGGGGGGTAGGGGGGSGATAPAPGKRSRAPKQPETNAMQGEGREVTTTVSRSGRRRREVKYS
jgi:hypothetical protein